MKEAGELFADAIEHWRDYKGRGTALIPHPLNDKVMVLGILQRVYARSPSCNTIILVPNFKERTNIIEFLTNQEGEEENNNEFKKLINDKHIKIFTYDYVDKNKTTRMPFLSIVYHPESIEGEVLNYVYNSKFSLVVLTKLLDDARHMQHIYKTAPLLPDFKQHEVEQLRLSTPVEEIQIGVDIPEDSNSAELLLKYNEYIATSVAIFGSFEIMSQAHRGNSAMNISANQICSKIAEENGWNENLDMSIEFNREIDKLYNPMNLKERATQTYEIVRLRSELLSNYNGKLNKIYEVVERNNDKKIIIINKRANFANEVTDYINNLSDTNICMNFHDKVDTIDAVDEEGNPIVYKSGVNKGKRKLMGAKAQKTLAIKKFNSGKINVLSCNNTPDKDLDVDVDIIIITSPLCEDIASYIYRLDKLNFRNSKLILYTIYCRNTQEQSRLENKQPMKHHNVKNDDEFVNNCDFIVDD